MKETFRQTKVSLILQGVFLLVAVPLVLTTDKANLHLWFNQWHLPFFDLFYKYITHLAEGPFIGLMVFIGLVIKFRHGVAGLIGIVGAGMLTQLFKRMVFNDHFRPAKVFEGLSNLHFVDGVLLHKMHSFPSGHSTAAFALFFFLAFLSPYRWLKVLCFCLALLTAFSRVYLSQHFFEDIVAGSVIGTTVCFVVLALLQNKKWGDIGIMTWLETKLKKS
jgi:membrane-associated phospholipid phosphatase